MNNIHEPARDMAHLFRVKGMEGLGNVFREFAAECSQDRMGFDKRDATLIAFAIGIAIRCEECIKFHIPIMHHDLQISDDEVQGAIAVAVKMGGGPGVMYGAKAWRWWKAFTEGRADE